MSATRTRPFSPLVRSLYMLSTLALAVSGFAQMPIFKRYYIADAPGLGWLAQFYVTHYMHYLAAAVLLGVSAYVLVVHLGAVRRRWRVTATGLIRGGVLAGLAASGLLLILRNLGGTSLPHGMIIFLDLFHLGLVMVLIATAAYCLVRRKRWLGERG